MDIEALHHRIEKQISDAAARYEMAASQLKYKAEIFKPDSPTVPTAVSVGIGWQDQKDECVWSLHYFYSPQDYKCDKDTELAKKIKSYLKTRKVKPF